MTRSEIVEKFRTHGCDINPGRMSVMIDPKNWDSDIPSVEIYSCVFYVWGDVNPIEVQKSKLKEIAFNLIEKGHGRIISP